MQNGSDVFTLAQDPNDLFRWSIEDQSVTGSQYTALRNQGLYAVVRTPAFPDGEVRGQIVTENSAAGSGDTFVVTAMVPDNGATVDVLPTTIDVTFNRPVGNASADQVTFEASGGDGSFGDGNEVGFDPTGVSATDAALSIDLTGLASADDVYQIVLDGSSAEAMADDEGQILDGDDDGAPGGDFVSTFTVVAVASAPTLTEVQTTVFTASCAFSGCHAGGAPAAGMDLSAGVAFSSIVDVLSTQSALDRVEPGDPDNSYLVRKIEGGPDIQGQQMPRNSPPLSQAQMTLIRDWISAGALDN